MITIHEIGILTKPTISCRSSNGTIFHTVFQWIHCHFLADFRAQKRKSAQLGACQGYAYPQDPTEPPLAAAAISPTSALELVGAAAKMGDGSWGLLACFVLHKFSMFFDYPVVMEI